MDQYEALPDFIQHENRKIRVANDVKESLGQYDISIIAKVPEDKQA